VSAFDSMKDKASDLVDKAKDAVTPEQVEKAVQAVGDKVDNLTGGKYAEHVDKAQQAVASAADKYLGDNDAEGPPPAGTPPTPPVVDQPPA
jgi:hypothetical protein